MTNPSEGDDEVRQNPDPAQREVDKEQDEALQPAADPDYGEELGDDPANEAGGTSENR